MPDTLSSSIKILIHELDHCWLGFNYREANNVADKLWKRKPFFASNFCSSPSFVVEELMYDAYGQK